jgi:TolA-binding protein
MRQPTPKRLVEQSDGLAATVLRSLSAPTPPPGARARVWRRIGKHSSRRVPGLWLVAPVAAAFVAVALATLVRPSAPNATPLATLSYATGGVRVAPPGDRYAVVRVGQMLVSGSGLRTAPTGRAYVRFTDAGMLVREHTEARIHTASSGPGISVSLEEGSIFAAVRHRPAERAFSVQAREYTIRVVGTLFSVAVSPDKQVTVRTTEGTVEVTGPDTKVLVHAGESWSSVSGSGRQPNEPSDAAFARSLLDGSPREGSPQAAAPGPTEARVLEHPADGETSPVAAAEIGPRQTSSETAPQEEPSRRRASHGIQPSPSKPLEPEVLTSPPAVEPTVAMAEPEESEAEAYARAARYEQEDRYSEAAKVYESLSTGGGAKAGPSLYRLGLLRERHLSDPEGAASSFAAYRKNFPSGDLAQDAAFSLVEVLVANRSWDQARTEMNRFLERYPASDRRDEVLLWRANAKRDRGDCAAALQDYALVAAARGVTGDDATFFAAFCEQKLGREAEARVRLQEYVRRHPDGRHTAEARRALGSGD